MHWDEHGTVRARVEAVEAPHRFAYRWTAHYTEAGAEPDATNSTLVEFTLAPHGDMTRLRVVESGFASLATSDEKRRSNYDANVDGWKQVIGQLDAHVAEVAV